MFEVVLRNDLQASTKIIDSVWAMKKKSNGTLHGRMNARGFKQVEGQHFDGTTINSPVTNSATIRIVLTLSVGQDVHMKSYTSEQGGCQEGSQGTQKGIPDFN